MSFYLLNLWLTSPISPENGAHWIFIPAGLALLLSLVFPISGPLGITLAAFPIALYIRFPGELIASLGIAITAGLAPFISRSLVVNGLKIYPDLSNLSTRNLTLCVLIYSLVRALIHHNWYLFMDLRESDSNGFTIEFIGNTLGALLILFIFKFFASQYCRSKA